jgi:hypothetical protein
MPSADKGELYIAKLDTAEPKPIATGITLNPGFDALSGDGSKALVLERGAVMTVYDLQTRAALGSARLPEGHFWFANFVTPDIVRVYAARENDDPLSIFEYDIRKRALQRTGAMPLTFHFNRDSTRAVSFWHRPALEIRDARTGTILNSVPPPPNTQIISATFLRDGRIAAVEDRKNGSVLRVFSADGVPIRDIALPGRTTRSFATEAGPGVVVVVIRSEQQSGFSAAAVDINRGVVIRTERALYPVNRASAPRLLCLSPQGLVVWNPATGEKKIVTTR